MNILHIILYDTIHIAYNMINLISIFLNNSQGNSITEYKFDQCKKSYHKRSEKSIYIQERAPEYQRAIPVFLT